MNAKGKRIEAASRLIGLLNLNPQTELVLKEEILSPLELIDLDNIMSTLDSAYKQRPEFQRNCLLVKSFEKEKKSTTTGLLLPELRFGAYGSYFGDVFSPVDPTGEINASVLWRIPLGRLAFAGKLKQYNSKIALTELATEQLKAQVNSEAFRSYEIVLNSREQMEVSEQGVQNARQALDQCVQRQQLGTVRPFEILQAQEIYIQNRIDYLQAVSNYNRAQYELKIALGEKL